MSRAAKTMLDTSGNSIGSCRNDSHHLEPSRAGAVIKFLRSSHHIMELTRNRYGLRLYSDANTYLLQKRGVDSIIRPLEEK